MVRKANGSAFSSMKIGWWEAPGLNTSSFAVKRHPTEARELELLTAQWL